MGHSELAEFLRSRRGAVQPADVGLPSGRRRQTPGLRREEVAQLAGMSVDYYVRLEQGRGPRPSRQVLGALSRALRLSNDEHAYVLHLVGDAPLPPVRSDQVPTGVLHLLDRLADTPAMVLDAKFDILAWNAMAAALFTDSSTLPSADRNLMRWHFHNAGFVMDPDDADRLAREFVNDLRAAAGRHPDDPAIGKLVTALWGESPQFAKLWSAHEIEVQRTSRIRMVHPIVGPIELESQALMVSCADQRLLFYTTAPGTSSHDALELLRVVGHRSLGPGTQPTPSDRKQLQAAHGNAPASR